MDACYAQEGNGCSQRAADAESSISDLEGELKAVWPVSLGS